MQTCWRIVGILGVFLAWPAAAFSFGWGQRSTTTAYYYPIPVLVYPSIVPYAPAAPFWCPPAGRPANLAPPLAVPTPAPPSAQPLAPTREPPTAPSLAPAATPAPPA